MVFHLHNWFFFQLFHGEVTKYQRSQSNWWARTLDNVPKKKNYNLMYLLRLENRFPIFFFILCEQVQSGYFPIIGISYQSYINGLLTFIGKDKEI